MTKKSTFHIGFAIGPALLALALTWGVLGIRPVEMAYAATLNVDNTNPACNDITGAPFCTIQAAVNAASSGDTINIAAGTYENVSVFKDLTLQGVGAASTIVDGDGTGWVISISSGTTVTISGMTIRNGLGGILNSNGVVEVTDSVVSDHNNSSGTGGGIRNMGTLTLSNSTVSGNTAFHGGGISNSYGTLTLVNSTISGNTASYGGGIRNWGNTLTLINSTVSDNSANNAGGGIFNNSTAIFKNTIVANNSGGNCGSGAVTSDGHNLDSGNTCGFTGPGDLTNTDPLLGPLQDNGGPSFTHALLSGSPAIDAGDNTGCPGTDQRGEPRPLDGDGDGNATCDIGAFEAPTAEGVDDWQNLGLYGANLDEDALLISADGDLYVCVNNGVYGMYQWNEGVGTWQPLTNTMGGCNDVAIDNVNDRLYRSGGGAGIFDHIFRSDDGGSTWTAILTPSHPDRAQVLAVAATTPNTLYVGMNVAASPDNQSGRIFHSANGGGSWNQAQLAPDGTTFAYTIEARIRDITVDPTDPSYVYFVADWDQDQGIYRSSDGGLTFRRIVTPTESDGEAIRVNANGTVFAIYNNTNLYRSRNHGDTWDDLMPPEKGGLGFHPTLTNTVFCGNFRSDDEGDTWDAWGNDQFDPPTIHPSITTTWYAPRAPGVWRSPDAGSNWEPINDGLQEVIIKRIAVAQNVTGTYWVVAPDTGVGYTKDDGVSWTFPVMRENEIIEADDVAIDPTNEDVVYLAYGEEVIKTTNGGEDWTTAWVTDRAGRQRLAIDPSATQTIYLAVEEKTAWGAVFKSTDGGSSWVTATLEGMPVLSLLVVTQTHTLYAGTAPTSTAGIGGVYSSTNGGDTWVSLGLTNCDVAVLEVDPRNPLHLYAGVQGDGQRYPVGFDVAGIYKSTDGGLTWDKLANDFGRVFDIAIDPQNPDMVYAIFWMNIYRSTDAGASWALYYHHDWQDPTYGRPWVLNLDHLPPATGSSFEGSGTVQSEDTAQSWLYMGSSRGLYRRVVASYDEGVEKVYLPIILKASP